jgi:hypothetical protein
MRRVLVLIAMVLPGLPAVAQVPSLRPPTVQYPSVQAPSIQSAPLPPLQEQQSVAPREAGPAARPSTNSNAPTVTYNRPDIWLPAGSAKLQALDKVDAQATALTIKVGQSATFGSLTIEIKACVVRPADQPADSAAYLNVTDSHPDSPGFAGWMLTQEPAASMMQHPLYDLRMTGCV